MSVRIAICGAQVPFVRDGTETLCESLRDELRSCGFDVEIVTIPFNWRSRLSALKSAFAWRLVDLEEVAGRRIDLVIATRFPAYLVRHPRKVVWLIHPDRHPGNLLETPFPGFSEPAEDRRVLAMIRAMDRTALGEASALFSISGTTANRLREHTGLEATPLYPPPKLGFTEPGEGYGDYVLCVGRLEAMKRTDLLVRALPHTRTAVRAVIAGSGPELEALLALARELGVAGRLELAGRVDDEELRRRYAGALGVFDAPLDEENSCGTVEALHAGRPILTTLDSSGVLELVEDSTNGFAVEPGGAQKLAARMDELFVDRQLAARLGEAGRRRVEGVTWDRVIAQLTAGH